MIKDITIGQYYRAESVVHRLDPRVKLFATLLYIISLFVVNSVVGYAIATICLFTAIKVSNIPIKYVLKGIKGIAFVLIFSGVFIVLFTKGDRELAKFWIFTISAEGIIKAIEMVYRLVLLILSSSIMTLTTTPTDMADGLEKAFCPLNYIKVPVHEMAMMVSIAFRFIPILMEETDKIMKAQIARGADFDEGGIMKKVKGLVPLLVPLLVSSIKRALDLATAMEARCYRGGEGRTKMKPLRYKRVDGIGYLVILFYFAVIMVLNIVVKIL